MNGTAVEAPATALTPPPGGRAPNLVVPVVVIAGMLGVAVACALIMKVVAGRHGEARHAEREREAMRVALAAAGSASEEGPARLPLMGDFPDFALTNHAGKPFGNTDLAGRVWVLQFFFACCDKSCPTMVRQMAELQRTLSQAEVRFVSISVDPDRDTPAGIATHAARFAEIAGLADRSRWSLLTGDRPRIVKLLEDCRLPVSPSALVDAGPLGHVDKFFLIDSRGRLRGMYNYDEAARMTSLPSDVATLLAESETAPQSAPVADPGKR